MKRPYSFGVTIIFWTLLLLLPGPAGAGEPTEQVRETVDEVIRILNDQRLKSPAKKEERRKLIRATVEKRFDFEEMAKRALGIHWRKRTPAEQKEYVNLFSDLLENTYVRKVERYENEKVNYLSEKTEGDYSVVKTRIITTKEVEIPVDYKILKKGGKWGVYDIIIEGVSLVNNYRTQFSQIISSGSFEELMKRLRAKTLKEP